MYNQDESKIVSIIFKFDANFSKFRRIRANVGPLSLFSTFVVNFLIYNSGLMPFLYFGLSISPNLRNCFTLKPMLNFLHNRLRFWRNRYASLIAEENFVPIHLLN